MTFIDSVGRAGFRYVYVFHGEELLGLIYHPGVDKFVTNLANNKLINKSESPRPRLVLDTPPYQHQELVKTLRRMLSICFSKRTL